MVSFFFGAARFRSLFVYKDERPGKKTQHAVEWDFGRGTDHVRQTSLSNANTVAHWGATRLVPVQAFTKFAENVNQNATEEDLSLNRSAQAAPSPLPNL